MTDDVRALVRLIQQGVDTLEKEGYEMVLGHGVVLELNGDSIVLADPFGVALVGASDFVTAQAIVEELDAAAEQGEHALAEKFDSVVQNLLRVPIPVMDVVNFLAFRHDSIASLLQDIEGGEVERFLAPGSSDDLVEAGELFFRAGRALADVDERIAALETTETR